MIIGVAIKENKLLLIDSSGKEKFYDAGSNELRKILEEETFGYGLKTYVKKMERNVKKQCINIT